MELLNMLMKLFSTNGTNYYVDGALLYVDRSLLYVDAALEYVDGALQKMEHLSRLCSLVDSTKRNRLF